MLILSSESTIFSGQHHGNARQYRIDLRWSGYSRTNHYRRINQKLYIYETGCLIDCILRCVLAVIAQGNFYRVLARTRPYDVAASGMLTRFTTVQHLVSMGRSLVELRCLQAT